MFFFVFFCLHRNYMNDSLRTNVFVRFQAETIACACIFLAARALQVRGILSFLFWAGIHTLAHQNIFSSNNSSLESNCLHVFCQIPLPSRPHWYLLFGASEDEIKDICITTLKLYTRKKVNMSSVFSKAQSETLAVSAVSLQWECFVTNANFTQIMYFRVLFKENTVFIWHLVNEPFTD